MFSSIKHKVALATAAGVLGMAGSALAASPALAYHLTYGSSTGAAVPVNTSYTATSNSVSFTSSTGGTYAKCTSSALSGVTTTINGATSGSPAAGLNVSGPPSGFSGCTITATSTPITVVGNYSTPWQVTPTSGTSSPFGGTVTNVSVTLTCSGTTATYSGNLTTGGTETNYNYPSYITLTNAGSLTKSGTGCAAIPSTVYVTGTYTLATLGGTAVSSTNNLWLNNN